ncbi:hypothetical protein [Caldifermentibacillus hisashii]|uniref:hypothetical protein n=1 Tax=Caldifermentibacillus hisashii TaxID=996558 RepID=UPI0031B6E937
MRVLYSPCYSDGKKIEYQFAGEDVTATYDGKTDTFYFTGLPDGKAESIETLLDINPILSAERVDGELKLVLLNFIGPDALDEEKFPEWRMVYNGENTLAKG